MKILILGGTGEVGHMLCKRLSSSHQVFTTLRTNNDLNSVNFFSKVLPETNCIIIDDIKDEKDLKNVINNINPDLIINCIAVIKHRDSCVSGNFEAEYINSIFPHFLKNECEVRNIKLIHLSTDCVFRGDKGNYSELHKSDASDFYGISKAKGEIFNSPNVLTIRTSFIGPSLFYKTGLFEWVKLQEGKTIDGFENAIYSGLTTIEFTRIIGILISEFQELNGLYNLSSDPISKFDLLNRINDKMNLNITINKETDFFCDRSLNSEKIKSLTKIIVPSWNKMIDELVNYNY
tara:strand:+ start:906 stop:1778 length:873 start_codon:yes stop_codon:yes gene_type:complete